MTLLQSKFDLTYSPALNGLRGYAILLVIIFHAAPHDWLIGGYLGVDVFFTLSGFLITNLLIKECLGKKRINLKNFYLRRCLRLLPALLLVITGFTIFSLIAFDRGAIIRSAIDSVIVLANVANWPRAFGIWRPEWLGNTWSLSIEEQFYLLWPPVLYFLTKRNVQLSTLIKIAIGIAVLAWGWRIYLTGQGADWMRVYNGTDTRIDSLLIGAALGIAVYLASFDGFIRANRKLISYLAVTASLIILGLSTIVSFKSPLLYYFILVIVELCTCVIILNACYEGPSIIKKALELPILVWLGSISYSLYLWHYPIFRALREMAEFSPLLILIVGTGISVCIAALSYYFVEKPILAYKQKLH
ncbi:acyltransferase [Saccharophagus degradans]|uniref:Acyltransferase n=1 Tax=Saccharophagus degradans TaxID=86304 RepID=A0AAW7XD19_9GAMM|nr:acyltransferase [Saccharophagus degradans]MBU2986874.1 acyltransferase [Saccharophagus degradans]MDO6424891.1 acyltransferase [Saccharophagus degradans]MDO6606679.1 acyltransferase [Saccharophagus degradans]